jgi:hypothetical protein
MTTPVEEIADPISNQSIRRRNNSTSQRPGTDDDGTVVGDGSFRHSPPRKPQESNLAVFTDANPMDDLKSIQSPSRTREEASRLEDDLTMLKAERQVSASEQEKSAMSRSKSIRRTRSKEPEDDFDKATTPTHEKLAYKPPAHPKNRAARIFKKIHKSSWLVRYFFYITPLTLLILIPLLLGALLFKNASVGGVQLVWFSIWLEIVWLSLWAGRVGFTLSYSKTY